MADISISTSTLVSYIKPSAFVKFNEFYNIIESSINIFCSYFINMATNMKMCIAESIFCDCYISGSVRPRLLPRSTFTLPWVEDSLVPVYDVDRLVEQRFRCFHRQIGLDMIMKIIKYDTGSQRHQMSLLDMLVDPFFRSCNMNNLIHAYLQEAIGTVDTALLVS